MLTAPYNFDAIAAGFTNLGLTADYVDMPFSGVATNRTWATQNIGTLRRFLAVYTKSIGWLLDPANRREAVDIMVSVSRLKADDVEHAYDFLVTGGFFEPTGTISKARLGKVVDALKELGDIPPGFATERLFLTEVTDIDGVALMRTIGRSDVLCRFRSLANAGARAPVRRGRHRHHRHRRLRLGQSVAGLHRHHPRASSPQRISSRHRLRAVEREPDPAAHGGLARHHHVDRAGRSDPRHRSGRADRDRALRDAGAALCAGGEARHREPRRPQGQADLARRGEGHHPHLCRAHAGAARRQAGEFDMVFAGATSARSAALVAGAVDAAILLPPFNFQAEAAGFRNLGLTIEYAPELPFSGTVVNKAWAARHQAVLARILSAHARSVAWFYDDGNRREAVRLMVAASGLKPDDVEKSYDFFRNNAFFDRSGRISKTKMNALLAALRTLGDVQSPGNIERFVLPGVAELAD